MSLQPSVDFTIPEETQRVARSALPKGNVYLHMRDALGVIYQDSAFASLFSGRGQPAEAPWRLVLVTIMQFMEGLTDRQAAEAVATRIDWKYVLALPITATSFHYSVLSEFRNRLLTGGAEEQLLDLLLARLRALDLLQVRGRQRTDSTHILAAVHVLNRVELVGETLRGVLEVLAETAPAWLVQQIRADWFDRYVDRVEQARLPKGQRERQALAETIGRDGYQLLQALYAAGAPAELRQTPAVRVLRRVWLQQYYVEDDQLHWRRAGNLPPAAQMIQSPHDPAAQYSQKRTTEWVGYKAHLTETCGDDRPHLIVNVETTPATEPDVATTNTVHAHLAAKDRLPDEHLLDAGYIDAANLAHAQAEYGVSIVGPVARDTAWQAQSSGAFDLTHFTINWPAQTATCPQGQVSHTWSASHDQYDNAVIHVRFAPEACRACEVRRRCTRAATGPRSLKLRAQAAHEALQQARERQSTPQYKRTYARRAGIEGTISLATTPYDLRHARYLGRAKTHLQNIVTAVAINIARVVAWLNRRAVARTRKSKFRALQPLFVQLSEPVALVVAT